MPRGKSKEEAAENKIKLDENYALCFDRYQYWIGKAVVSKTGNPRYDRVSGFCPKLEDALTSFFEHNPKYNEANTFKQLEKLVKDTRRDIKKWCATLQDMREEQITL